MYINLEVQNMSRSLIISLVASVVVGSAQAGYEQALELGRSAVTKVAPYMTAKTAGILATTGLVGYGLKKAYSCYTTPKVIKSTEQQQANDYCSTLTQGVKQNTATLQPGFFARAWANCPSMKTVGVATAATIAAGAAYYFRSGLANGLTTVASKAWNAMPSKETLLKIKQ